MNSKESYYGIGLHRLMRAEACLGEVGLASRCKGDVGGLQGVECGVVRAALDDTAAVDAPRVSHQR